MAISSSGSVSLNQIQTEFGGSGAISLSEYYTNSNAMLAVANTSGGVSETPSVTSSTATQSAAGPDGITGTNDDIKYVTTTHIGGFIHSSLAGNFANSLNVGDNSDTWSYVSGADFTGNAGAIPSSGNGISFDHFRGTNKGTSSSIICYGLIWIRLSNAVATTSTVRAYFGGHLGTNNQTNQSWDGFPFTSITVGAEGNISQTTLTFSGTHSANGSVGVKTDKNHQNNSTIGNYTQCFWNAANTTTQWSGFSGTWNLTVNY